MPRGKESEDKDCSKQMQVCFGFSKQPVTLLRLQRAGSHAWIEVLGLPGSHHASQPIVFTLWWALSASSAPTAAARPDASQAAVPRMFTPPALSLFPCAGTPGCIFGRDALCWAPVQALLLQRLSSPPAPNPRTAWRAPPLQPELGLLQVCRVQCQVSFGKLCMASHGAKWAVKWRNWRLNAGLISICLGVDRVSSTWRENERGRWTCKGSYYLHFFISWRVLQCLASFFWHYLTNTRELGVKEENYFALLLQDVCVQSCVTRCSLLHTPNLKLSKAGVASWAPGTPGHPAVQCPWRTTCLTEGQPGAECAGRTVRHSCAPVGLMQPLRPFSTGTMLFLGTTTFYHGSCGF